MGRMTKEAKQAIKDSARIPLNIPRMTGEACVKLIRAGLIENLQDWQEDYIYELHELDRFGSRIKSRSLFSIPRKNGKTELCAALAVVYLVHPLAGSGNLIVAVSHRMDHAALIYDAMYIMTHKEGNERLRELLKCSEGSRKKEILNVENYNRFQCFPGTHKKLQGILPSLFFIDEYSDCNPTILDALSTGQRVGGMGGLGIVMSTLNRDPLNPTSVLLKDIEKGRRNDPEGYKFWHTKVMHGHVYTEREARDYNLNKKERYEKVHGPGSYPKNWLHNAQSLTLKWSNILPANPVAKVVDFKAIKRLRTEAKNSYAKYLEFCTFVINQNVSSEAQFIDPVLWDAHADPSLKMEDFDGQECILGLDLSEFTDLASLGTTFLPTKERPYYVMFCDSWMPQDNVEKQQNKDDCPWTSWADKSSKDHDPYLHLCEGDAFEHWDMAQKVIEYNKRFRVTSLNYDRFGYRFLKKSYTDRRKFGQTVDGHWVPEERCHEVGQNFYLNDAMRMMHNLLKQGKIKHPGIRHVNASIYSTKIKMDTNGKWTTDKGNKYDRKDPVDAMLDTLSKPYRSKETALQPTEINEIAPLGSLYK